MAYSKKTWADRQVEHPGRRKLTSTGTTDVYDVTREEGLVIEEGDALNASTFNDLENRIDTAFSESSLREVYTLTHQKSGTTHALTGLTGVSGTVSCVFTATAAFAAGDTFTVDGELYTVQLSNGEAAEDSLFVSGAAVPVIVDTGAKKVNFKAGGGGYQKNDIIAPKNLEAVYKEDTNFFSTTVLTEVGDSCNVIKVDPENRYIYAINYYNINIFSTSGEHIVKVSQGLNTYASSSFFDPDGNLIAYVSGDPDYFLKISHDGTVSTFFSLNKNKSASAENWGWYNDRAYILLSNKVLYHVNANGETIAQYTLSDEGIVWDEAFGIDDTGSMYEIVQQDYDYWFLKRNGKGAKTWKKLIDVNSVGSYGFAIISNYVYFIGDNSILRISKSGTFNANFSISIPITSDLFPLKVGDTTYIACGNEIYDVTQKTSVCSLESGIKAYVEIGRIYGFNDYERYLFTIHQEITGYKVLEVIK